jgi:hypothetical protein
MQTSSEVWARICERHPDEWVCLVDVAYDMNGGIKAGVVVAHNRSLNAVLPIVEVWGDSSVVTQTDKRPSRTPCIVVIDT